MTISVVLMNRHVDTSLVFKRVKKVDIGMKNRYLLLCYFNLLHGDVVGVFPIPDDWAEFLRNEQLHKRLKEAIISKWMVRSISPFIQKDIRKGNIPKSYTDNMLLHDVENPKKSPK